MTQKKPIKMFLFFLTSLCLVALVMGSSQVLAVQADAEFDLEISLKAPQHVAPGSNTVINLSYSNIGTAESPADTRIQVVLPEGLSLVSAVDQDDNPLPPTSIDSNVFTWTVGVLPAGSCCAHIWITTLAAADLVEETILTTTAEISTATPETNLTNNLASVTSQVCDMAGLQDEHMFGQGGGEWQHAWGLTLTVPPGAVREMTRFQFRPLSETPPDAPPGWIYAHRAFELNAFQSGEIHSFNQPIEIRLRYTYDDIKGIYPNSLRLWYRAGPGEPWAMLGEPLRHQFGQITFSTDHFTEFALFGQQGSELMLPLVIR